MTFDQIYPYCSKDEGGYSNKPNDRGGETYGGIARNYIHNQSWDGWAILDQIKKERGPLPDEFVSPILNDMVKKFFKEKNWDIVQMDSFPASLRYLIFDVLINFGFDPDTLASKAWAFIRIAAGQPYSSAYKAELYWLAEKITPEKFTEARKAQYRRFVANDPTQEEFLDGWLARADEVLKITKAAIIG
jgi:lysozyme family protein